MKTLSFMFLVLLALFSLFLATASAGIITSTRLIENSKVYNGKEISYQGEVVGDVMVRGEHAWINVNDGVNAMGVWIPAAKTTIIKIRGDYKHRGDVVKIMGVFNRACALHGGDMDIHALSLRVIKRGHLLEHTVKTEKLLLAAALSFITGILFFYNKRLSRRRA